jgi:WD40 repeat protein
VYDPAELVAAGYDVAAIVSECGFSVQQMHRHGISCEVLHQTCGFTVSQFKEADVPIPELLPIFPLTCMLSEGHYSPADLKLKGGVTADDAFRGSVSLASLGQVYDPAELVAAGYDVAAIVSECGFSVQQMQRSFYKRLTGHTDSVSCVCVLPDGRVVSGSYDESLRLWNPDTGACERTLTGHTSVVSCVCVLPEGRVVSGSGDSTLRLWNPDTGACERTLTGHTHSVSCVCVLPDGRVVSGSYDSTLRLWNPDTGACERTLTGHTDCVVCVCVLPDGRVVSGSHDKTLRVSRFIEA